MAFTLCPDQRLPEDFFDSLHMIKCHRSQAIRQGSLVLGGPSHSRIAPVVNGGSGRRWDRGPAEMGHEDTAAAQRATVRATRPDHETPRQGKPPIPVTRKARRLERLDDTPGPAAPDADWAAPCGSDRRRSTRAAAPRKMTRPVRPAGPAKRDAISAGIGPDTRCRVRQ